MKAAAVFLIAALGCFVAADAGATLLRSNSGRRFFWNVPRFDWDAVARCIAPGRCQNKGALRVCPALVPALWIVSARPTTSVLPLADTDVAVGVEAEAPPTAICPAAEQLKKFKKSRAKLAQVTAQKRVVSKALASQKKALKEEREAAKKELVEKKITKSTGEDDLAREAVEVAKEKQRIADAAVKHSKVKKGLKAKIKVLTSKQAELTKSFTSVKAEHAKVKAAAVKSLTASLKKVQASLKLVKTKPAAAKPKFADEGLAAEDAADAEAQAHAAVHAELEAALAAGDAVSAETEAVLESLAEADMEEALAGLEVEGDDVERAAAEAGAAGTEAEGSSEEEA